MRCHSRLRETEFIFSHSRDWRNFQLHHLMFIFKVFLYLKNLSVGRARAEDGITVALQNDQLTIQSTLNLKKGDRVWVQNDRISPGAFLYDSGAHFTHFTGFMLEDEIVASL